MLLALWVQALVASSLIKSTASSVPGAPARKRARNARTARTWPGRPGKDWAHPRQDIGEVRKWLAERVGRRPPRPAAVAAVMRGAQGPYGQAGSVRGLCGRCGGLCGRHPVAVIGILPIGDHEELPGDGQPDHEI